jgi:hypothetical protein
VRADGPRMPRAGDVGGRPRCQASAVRSPLRAHERQGGRAWRQPLPRRLCGPRHRDRRRQRHRRRPAGRAPPRCDASSAPAASCACTSTSSRAGQCSRGSRALDATLDPPPCGGCHLARDTLAAIERAGSRIERSRRFGRLFVCADREAAVDGGLCITGRDGVRLAHITNTPAFGDSTFRSGSAR